MPPFLSLDSALVVEDNYLLAHDLAQILQRHGCAKTEIVGSCDEAIAQITSRAFDLVTVDVRLRGGDCMPPVEVLRKRQVSFV